MRLNFLILASLFFYATWSFIFMIHLIVVVGINYMVMELWRIHRKKWIFVILQIANISNIIFFKYFYFLSDVIGRLLGQAWMQEPHLRLAQRAAGAEILLPLAISFYTFQIMAYGFDIVRKVYDERHSFREVLLFKTFFPQLIAGPIMRSSELLPQIRKLRESTEWVPDYDMMKRGIWLVLLGLLKKIVVADPLLGYTMPLISGRGGSPADYSSLSIWSAVMGSMMMLYTDFSAYTDLARGFGLLMGFEIPINFRAPFFMRSISDFWRRWHLTFSLWIRDYIYIPLGGSRVKESRNYLNLVFTFFLGGLWHGASYNFVIWGTVMGIMLSTESFMERRGIPEWPASIPGRIARLAVTWILFSAATIFFFAPTLDWSLQAFGRMFVPFLMPARELQVLTGGEIVWFSVLATLLFHWIDEKPSFFRGFRKYENWLLPVSSMVVILLLTQFAGGQKDFFYFQF